MRSLSRRLSPLVRRDDGQLVLLVICYAAIGALLVTVVVNASRAFLERRSLTAAADGAATAAASAVDLGAFYDGDIGDALPLAQAAVAQAVTDYVADAGLPARFTGFTVLSQRTDGAAVTVSFGARVRLPFLNLLSSAYADGLAVTGTATATAPLSP